MFSLTSLQPQVVTALKQFSLIVNGSRALSTESCLRGRRHRSLQKKNDPPQREMVHSSQRDQEFCPLICSPARGDSYVSSPTFFENKYGFEDPSFTRPTKSVITLRTMEHKPLLQSHHPWHSSVRLFYIRREGTGESKSDATDQPGLREVKKTVEDQYAVLKELAEMSTQQAAQNTNLLKQQQLKNLEEKYAMLMTQVRDLSSKKKSTLNYAVQILSYVAAVILLVIIIVRITGSNVINGNSKTFSVVAKDMIEEKFSDVHGMDEAKDDMIDIVKFLQNPEPFNQVGAKIPKGILLEGPPGVGKTMLARAVAGEAGVPFIFASGSEFDEIFVGVGAKRVRELFDTARHIAPCIVFIDEIDSLATTRTQSPYSTPAAYQSINQLLTELDGFQSMNGIILIAATNRKDALDPAILRPGRLDMHISVEKPDLKGREKIFQQYLSKVKHDPEINITHLALGTSGFTGADISSMVNQAALKAGIDGVSSVTMSHLNYAKDKILMGSEKKTRTPDERVNWCTAIHEAGHTIVGMESKTSVTDVYKVTIKSRGGNHSLGHTQFLPKTELYDESRAQLMNELDICMGGRVAEEIIFGANEVTTGASSDFKTATAIAKEMVMHYGMSDNLGMRVYSTKDLQMMSPKMRKEVDDEVNKLLQDSYNRTKKLLIRKKDKLMKLAEMLMKYETLDMQEIRQVMEGKDIVRS